MGELKQIGKVNIDLSDYPGEDLYSEGAIEDELLKVAENNSREDFRRIIEENTSWPYLYHFSPVRENIVSWLPIKKEDKILEVGAGMGAITNALCTKAGSVESIDLSLKRSLVNAQRNKDMDNLSIRVGNFKDIEPKLESDYDWIMLIGVFEYAISYMSGNNPFTDFLKILMKHLKPGGRLVIAIENRLGLKYFAGCKEDHTCGFFDGIENYKKGGQVRTFSRAGLERIFAEAGVKEYHFYYPYPDYKLPNTIFSDKRLPLFGELRDNIRNFDQDRVILFDETNGFDGMISEGIFPIFSNSYEVIIGPDVEVDYAKYSVDRNDEFCVSTSVVNENGVKKVVKKAENIKAFEHISNMYKAYDVLSERFRESELEINKVLDFKPEEGTVSFEFVQGRTLESIFDECVKKSDKNEFLRLFDKYKRLVFHNEEAPVFDSDMIFPNIIVDDNEVFTVIDYEWTKFTKGNSYELVQRAIDNYLLPNNFRCIISEWIDTNNEYEEDLFQERINGKIVTMPEIRHKIGKGAYSFDYMTDRVAGLNARFQIYEDYGDGFSEKNSYFLEDVKKYGANFLLEIEIKEGMKAVRIDPGDKPARFYVNQISCNDSVLTDKMIGVTKNGCADVRNTVQKGNVFIFKKEDPHFKLPLKGMGLESGDILKIDCRLEYIY